MKGFFCGSLEDEGGGLGLLAREGEKRSWNYCLGFVNTIPREEEEEEEEVRPTKRKRLRKSGVAVPPKKASKRKSRK